MSPIRMEDIAASAHYSKYHFQRLFSIVTGETVGSYLRKRRLSEAARQLIHSQRSIIDIALDYQFQSQESFSRSFKDYFGKAPFQFRKQTDRGSPDLPSHLESRVPAEVHKSISQEPEFVTVGMIPLIGLSYFGHNQDEIKARWANLERRQAAINHIIVTCKRYGLVHYDDSFFKSRDFGYLAAFELKGPYTLDLQHVPFDFILKILPAAKYAVFTHQGPVETIPLTYEFIYGQWLLPSDFHLVAPFDFEFYDHEFNPDQSETLELKIYIPIELII